MAEQTMPEWRAYTTESACPMSEERHSFVHGERVVYQWTQSLRYAGIAIPNLVGRILNFHRHPVFLTCLTITTPSRAYIYVRRSEVNVFIPEVPAGVCAKDLKITIQPGRVVVQLHGHTYLDHFLSHTIKASESIWTYDGEEREIHILLAKAEESTVWACVFVGHQQEGAAGEDRKRLMLERFQEEDPGFDFRGAEFTGNVPDPKTFLRHDR